MTSKIFLIIRIICPHWLFVGGHQQLSLIMALSIYCYTALVLELDVNLVIWLQPRLLQCTIQHFLWLWEVVCRFQVNNSPFPSTDESLYRDDTNKFSSNLQYLVGDRLIISFFLFWCACIHLNGVFSCLFASREKVKISRTMILCVLKK